MAAKHKINRWQRFINFICSVKYILVCPISHRQPSGGFDLVQKLLLIVMHFSFQFCSFFFISFTVQFSWLRPTCTSVRKTLGQRWQNKSNDSRCHCIHYFSIQMMRSCDGCCGCCVSPHLHLSSSSQQRARPLEKPKMEVVSLSYFFFFTFFV